ncbi:hypothetical protein IFR05_009620 [Cadophora sp. M221]|nr:hypothetical protein IFR05_009620 [Cadophora sp. M221]
MLTFFRMVGCSIINPYSSATGDKQANWELKHATIPSPDDHQDSFPQMTRAHYKLIRRLPHFRSRDYGPIKCLYYHLSRVYGTKHSIVFNSLIVATIALSGQHIKCWTLMVHLTNTSRRNSSHVSP